MMSTSGNQVIEYHSNEFTLLKLKTLNFLSEEIFNESGEGNSLMIMR